MAGIAFFNRFLVARRRASGFFKRMLLAALIPLGLANVAWSQSLVCSDFAHVNQSTANDIADFFGAPSRKYFWGHSKETEGVQKAFLFIDNGFSAEVRECAKELEKLGHFGAFNIAKGMAFELGSVRRHEVLKFDFEVQESKASLSIDTLSLKMYASTLSEPFRSISALEILVGLPVGECTQNENCYKFLEERIIGSEN